MLSCLVRNILALYPGSCKGGESLSMRLRILLLTSSHEAIHKDAYHNHMTLVLPH